MRPYVEHVLDAFGPERCLWGSDWPVVNLGADLPAWIAAFREHHGRRVTGRGGRRRPPHRGEGLRRPVPGLKKAAGII